MSHIIKCPRCGKTTVYDATNPHRPFCSERCKYIDFGKWVDGEFRVETEDSPTNENEGSMQDQDIEENENE